MTPAEMLANVDARGLGDLLRQVAAAHHVLPEEVFLRSRSAPIVYARQEFWWRVIVERGWTTIPAGKLTGHDHTTVVYGMQAHEKRYRVGRLAEAAE